MRRFIFYLGKNVAPVFFTPITSIHAISGGEASTTAAVAMSA
jgi:hypothetical protein